MADNIIKRIIALVLDKDSAKKTQDDANAVASGIDSAFKSLGTKIAGYLGAGLLLSKIVSIGKAAVEQATASEAAWSSLKGTVDNTGASFDAMEDKLRATADAFQDATIHDDDAFAVGLDRLISLTGDATASLNNMGLVADVASKFFKGDLEPATNLVAKAMNGNVTALKKLGIEADDAQQALEILATRSMGAATRQAGTFNGQLAQLSNTWDDILKDLGQAIIQGEGATTAFDVLRAALQTLGQWVAANKEEIRLWVTNGVMFAIDAADVFIRAVTGMASILKGGLSAALGLAAVGIGKLLEGYAKLREIEDDVREKLGQDVTKRREFTKEVLENAKAMQEFGKETFNAGKDSVTAGFERLSNRLFSSDQFRTAPARTAPVLPGGKPTVAAGARTEQSEAIKKAVEEFEQAGRRIAKMDELLGPSFDLVGEEIERITKLLEVFAEQGVNPATEGFGKLEQQLVFLQDVTGPTNTALNELYRSLGTDLTIATAQGATSLEKLNIEADAVLKTIQELSKTPSATGAAEALTNLTARYRELQEAIKDQTATQAFSDSLKELGETMRGDMVMATLDNVDTLGQLEMQRRALSRAIQQGIALNKQEDASFKQLVQRYKEVTGAIEDQSDAMMVQATAADFLAEALGVALQGGIHEAASTKAKQTGIEALEWLVRAGAYALFGNFAGAAGAVKTAASFGAVALAWKALAMSTKGSGKGGSSGGGDIPSASGGGGGSLGALGAGTEEARASRETASSSASRSTQPAPEVTIVMVGPGFDALNPTVQRVVRGATQVAEERYGPNAKIRIGPNEGR